MAARLGSDGADSYGSARRYRLARVVQAAAAAAARVAKATRSRDRSRVLGFRSFP